MGTARWSNYQLILLEDYFWRISHYVRNRERSDLAERLGVSENHVMNWFQNRRSKLRAKKNKPPIPTQKSQEELNCLEDASKSAQLTSSRSGASGTTMDLLQQLDSHTTVIGRRRRRKGLNSTKTAPVDTMSQDGASSGRGKKLPLSKLISNEEFFQENCTELTKSLVSKKPGFRSQTNRNSHFQSKNKKNEFTDTAITTLIYNMEGDYNSQNATRLDDQKSTVFHSDGNSFGQGTSGKLSTLEEILTYLNG